MAVITDDMKMAMQGMIPSTLVTCSRDGVPNTAYISQVYYVDDTHVAVSHQFFTKSIRNINENPQACVSIVSPEDAKMWKLDLTFSHSETSGDIYDQMSVQLEAIASMTGMEDVFRLQSAYIFNIDRIEEVN